MVVFLLYSHCGNRSKITLGGLNSFQSLKDSWPLDVLINLWLGHKEVLTFGWFRKLYYSDSLNQEFLLKIAKEFTLERNCGSCEGSVIDYVFGAHAKIIIPALIEMGIFEKVARRLLEEASLQPLEERIRIAKMISIPELNPFFFGGGGSFYFSEDGYLEMGALVKVFAVPFILARKRFCEQVTVAAVREKYRKRKILSGKELGRISKKKKGRN